MPGQSGGYNGGNMVGYYYEDSVNSSFSHTASYAYDALDRLTSAVAPDNPTYNLTFSYDRYGNMSCTQNQQTQGLCPQYSFNSANNRITDSGFTYDDAGNLTGDGTNTYQYDAEQHAATVNGGSTVGFTYNALGLRVQSRWPSGTGDFLYDPNGTWQGVANDMSEVYLGSRLVAVPDRFGETLFPHVNLLDSITMETYYNGAVGTDAMISPWGNWWQTAGLIDFQFAGTIWTDTAASVDYASYRFYRYDLGRWPSPDPLGGDITNPQSLNRYAYALNNPTTLTDPLGLDAAYCGTTGRVSAPWSECQSIRANVGPAWRQDHAVQVHHDTRNEDSRANGQAAR